MSDVDPSRKRIVNGVPRNVAEGYAIKNEEVKKRTSKGKWKAKTLILMETSIAYYENTTLCDLIKSDQVDLNKLEDPTENRHKWTFTIVCLSGKQYTFAVPTETSAFDWVRTIRRTYSGRRTSLSREHSSQTAHSSSPSNPLHHQARILVEPKDGPIVDSALTEQYNFVLEIEGMTERDELEFLKQTIRALVKQRQIADISGTLDMCVRPSALLFFDEVTPIDPELDPRVYRDIEALISQLNEIKSSLEKIDTPLSKLVGQLQEYYVHALEEFKMIGVTQARVPPFTLTIGVRTATPRLISPDALDKIEGASKEKHGVNHVTYYNGVYWKQSPEYPAIEFAVDLASKLVTSQGCPPTLLIKRIRVDPTTLKPESVIFQASKGVPGVLVSDMLRDERELIADIDSTNYAYMFTMALLTLPQDGKGDNIIATKNELGRIIFTSIDNDHSFADPVCKSANGNHFINVRSILFCLPQANEKFSPAARYHLLALSPELVTVSWLKGLHEQNSFYKELEEDDNHFTTKDLADMNLPVKLRAGTASAFCRTFQLIQAWLKESPNITPNQIFAKLYPLLYCYYDHVLQKHVNSKLSIEELFAEHIFRGNYYEDYPELMARRVARSPVQINIDKPADSISVSSSTSNTWVPPTNNLRLSTSSTASLSTTIIESSMSPTPPPPSFKQETPIIETSYSPNNTSSATVTTSTTADGQSNNNNDTPQGGDASKYNTVKAHVTTTSMVTSNSGKGTLTASSDSPTLTTHRPHFRRPSTSDLNQTLTVGEALSEIKVTGMHFEMRDKYPYEELEELLREINLDGMDPGVEQSLIRKLCTFPYVTFTLVGSKQFTNRDLDAIISNSPCLLCLELRNCPKITAEALKLILLKRRQTVVTVSGISITHAEVSALESAGLPIVLETHSPNMLLGTKQTKRGRIQLTDYQEKVVDAIEYIRTEKYDLAAKRLDEAEVLHRGILKTYQPEISALLSSDLVKPLIKATPEKLLRILVLHQLWDINLPAANADSPWHLAVKDGNEECCKLMLQLGANPNLASLSNQRTPLHLSVVAGHIPIIKQLLEAKADINALDVTKKTPLALAIQSNYNSTQIKYEIIELLMSASPDLELKYEMIGDTALHMAINRNMKKAADLLIKHVAPINATNSIGESILHVACLRACQDKHTTLASSLLLLGASTSPKAVTNDGSTPLAYAVKGGAVHIVADLIKAAPESVTAVDSKKCNLLHIAAGCPEYFSKDMLKLLLAQPKLQELINVRSDFSKTPIHVAAVNRNVPAMKLLCGADADANISDASGTSALTWGVNFGDLDAVKFLVRHGKANPNCFCEAGYNPMWRAVAVLYKATLTGPRRDQSLGHGYVPKKDRENSTGSNKGGRSRSRSKDPVPSGPSSAGAESGLSSDVIGAGPIAFSLADIPLPNGRDKSPRSAGGLAPPTMAFRQTPPAPSILGLLTEAASNPPENNTMQPPPPQQPTSARKRRRVSGQKSRPGPSPEKPLHHLQVADFLASNGGDLSIPNENGDYFVHYLAKRIVQANAVNSGCGPIELKFLSDHNVDLLSQNANQDTILHIICSSRVDARIVHGPEASRLQSHILALLNLVLRAVGGVGIHTENNEGFTPLHLSIKVGSVFVVKRLAEQGGLKEYLEGKDSKKKKRSIKKFTSNPLYFVMTQQPAPNPEMLKTVLEGYSSELPSEHLKASLEHTKDPELTQLLQQYLTKAQHDEDLAKKKAKK